MDPFHREILNRLRSNIIEDIDVHNGIINFLLQEEILNNNDIDEINVAASKSDKAAALLDMLPNRGPRAFKYFQESLRPQYPWLNERMAELEQSSDQYISNEMESEPSSTPAFVPQIPLLTVPRHEKTEQLKRALMKLTPGAYVVLHGMKGFGKSWLARSIINGDKDFVKNVFGNQVYWLKFGCKGPIEDELLIQLNHLYHLVAKATIRGNSTVTNEMLRLLKQHFLSTDYNKALLILDDVWDKLIIERFDFACKTLVITTNIDLIDSDRISEFIEMKNGFTEAESLQLFAQALSVDSSRLPEEAREIHNECNGMPLLIAMFAAQFEEFKDDMAINRGRWQYYLKALRKKDTTNQLMEKFLAKQELIFDMCINQLPVVEQNRYKMLAIFDEDVNITPKTLEVLWGEKSYRVEEIMVGLCHKSLAVKQWNGDLGTYIYGIHDLLVVHLRKKIVQAELTKQHKSFVEKIFRYCKNDYSKMPLDNYCYSYIGHHLKKAKMYRQLREIYLDFKFLQAKIKNSGINDLLIDLQKYRNHITDHDKDMEEKVLDLENVIRTYARILADHRHRNCIDLVQIALNHHKPGYCYDIARDFAHSNPKYFYFSHTRQHENPESPTCTEMPSELTTINFTDDPNQVLIGDKHGQVRQCGSKGCPHSFNFHEKSEIIRVIVSLQGDFFLALNNKSTIKRFLLKHIFECGNSSDDDEDYKITTPREKQTFWNNVHREPKDTSTTTYRVESQQITDIALSSDGARVAACTAKGVIVVWDINGEIIATMNSSENGLQRIIFTKVRKYIHALDTKGLLTVYTENGGHYVGPSQFNVVWKDQKNPGTYSEEIKVIYFQGIPSLESEVEIYTVIVTRERAFIFLFNISGSGTLCNPSRRNLFEAENCKFNTAVLTHDDKYLITAGTDDIVKVWDIVASFESKKSYTARAISLDTYCEEDSHIIISGYKQSIQRFTFCEKDDVLRSIKKPLFDTVMKPLGHSDIVVQEAHGNKIGLYHGYEMIADFQCKSKKIQALSLNTEANKILYTSNNGDVYLCNVNDGSTTLIMTLSEISSFVRFLGVGNTIVCKDKEELIFWCDGHQSMTRPNNVIDVHVIRNNYVLTISREGNIIIWQKIHKDWQAINSRNSTSINNESIRGAITIRNSNIYYSSLNLRKNMLALLNVTCELILYDIMYDENAVPKQIQQYGCKKYFDKKLECCAFSPDGKYVAIGTYDGDIVIYDIYDERNCGQLRLHCNSVRQLHWAPAAIGIPILFSVNCDELAAWNIDLLPDKNRKFRRSRTGMQRSVTTSFSNTSAVPNLPISSSQTVSADLSCSASKQEENQNESNATSLIEKSREFWSSKVPKDPNFPALLGLIPLPLSCNAKLSVSPDCKKFLSVDVYGCINNFTFFDSTERNDEN